MSTMSKEGECSLAKGHGEINASTEVMAFLQKPVSMQRLLFLRNLKELMDLELIATNVNILTLFEKKKK
jgi:hypothetical protein